GLVAPPSFPAELDPVDTSARCENVAAIRAMVARWRSRSGQGGIPGDQMNHRDPPEPALPRHPFGFGCAWASDNWTMGLNVGGRRIAPMLPLSEPAMALFLIVVVVVNIKNAERDNGCAAVPGWQREPESGDSPFRSDQRPCYDPARRNGGLCVPAKGRVIDR
ncbi:MAG: hypothetical protein ACTHMX_05150, partial [Thermomicrobiales bacterium]